jgi:ferritin
VVLAGANRTIGHKKETGMLSKGIQDAVNEQIKNELYSAYLYLSMSAFCESANYPGAAKWLAVQAREEVGHAMKFYRYVHDRGGRVILQPVDQPPSEFKSLAAIFEQALEHERKVTGMINRIYGLAAQENDYATQVQLQWFIDEQVEEEKNATQIADQLKKAGDHLPVVLMVDAKLGERSE